MSAIGNGGAWLSPNSVSILAQPKTAAFASFLLTQASIPSPGRVRLDLAETEDFRRSYTVTRNPVERLTAQNKIREPDELVVTGMLSANPIGASPLGQLGLARLDRHQLAKLRDLVDQRELLFVITPERYFANAICTSMVERFDESTGNGVSLQLTFVEIVIVGPGAVAGVLDLDTLGMGAGGTSDLGAQAPASIPDTGGLG